MTMQKILFPGFPQNMIAIVFVIFVIISWIFKIFLIQNLTNAEEAVISSTNRRGTAEHKAKTHRAQSSTCFFFLRSFFPKELKGDLGNCLSRKNEAWSTSEV